jgi:hypothetical protein
MSATLPDRFLAIVLLITGVSHVVQPQMWTTFFDTIYRARIAAVVIAMYTLPTGLVVLLSHQDWSWGPQWWFIPFGLGFTFKGTLYLVAPGVADFAIKNKGPSPGNLRVAGLLLTVLALPIIWVAFT